MTIERFIDVSKVIVNRLITFLEIIKADFLNEIESKMDLLTNLLNQSNIVFA